MFDIACIGIAVTDIIAKPIENTPKKGTLMLTDKIAMHTGGCAVNTAIDLTKIGKKPAIIIKTGNDSFGEFLKKELNDSGADITGVKTSKNINTSASVVLVDNLGERSFIHALGANADFTYNDVDFSIIENSHVIFIGGFMLMPKFDGEPCAKVLCKAKEMGKLTALDVAWDSSNQWMSILKPCMQYIDYFMPSYEEAVLLSGKDNPEDIADVFLSMGVKTAVIKLGKNGCFIKNKKSEQYLIPTFNKLKCIDATGAGDSFVAGFLTGISEGWNLLDCGIFANAVGTHCVMEMGASTGIKSLSEIQQFINEYNYN